MTETEAEQLAKRSLRVAELDGYLRGLRKTEDVIVAIAVSLANHAASGDVADVAKQLIAANSAEFESIAKLRREILDASGIT